MPHSQSRRRKVAVLTPQGFQKLQAAISQSKLWKPDTRSCPLEALSEQTGLSTQTLSKVHARQANVDLRTLVRYFQAFNLTLDPGDYLSPAQTERAPELAPGLPCNKMLVPNLTVSWDIAPDVSVFYGRATDLDTLQHWVLQQRCRLVVLVGMGGIGKTWLATKLAEQVQHEFQTVIWRSLQPLSRSSHPTPSFSDFIDDLIRHLAPQRDLHLPETNHAKIRFLLDCLHQTRCLLVLDNVESVLQGCASTDTATNSITVANRSDYEEYEALLRYLSQGRHQSCVLLTSREEPKIIQQLSGDYLSIRVLPLQGLQLTEAQQIFQARGVFQGSSVEWNQLISYYGGNPLILEIVATTIQQLFAGSLTAFFEHNILIFDEVRKLLNQQLKHLSYPEQIVIEVLANHNTSIEFTELRSRTSPIISTAILLAALRSMKARSLLERTAIHFSLPPLLRDYMGERYLIQKDVIRSDSNLAFT